MIEIDASLRSETTFASPSYDLAIIGSGSAAFAAAIRARSHGARVLMIERATIGGTCVNVGCIPSKYVLHAVERHHVAAECALTTGSTPPAFQVRAAVDGKEALVAHLRRAKYEDLVERYGFTFRNGAARFSDERKLDVDGERIEAEAFLIATGARAVAPPIAGLEETGYLTSTTALELREIPPRLAVIGGNAIGLELGQYFARAGSVVTVFEALDRIAPLEEPEISEALADALGREGIAVVTGVRITSVLRSASGVSLEYARADTQHMMEIDAVLVAVGRRPSTSGLGLDAAGVRTGPDGTVVVDEFLRTTNPRIYAAGDVTGAPQFVYVAGYQGTLAADNALGKQRAMSMEALPRVIFTSPQVAAVGLTEAQARQRGLCCLKTAMLSLGENLPRAIVNGSDGVMKMVAEEESGRILGVHMVGDSAGEVIQAATLAVKMRLSIADLLDTFHPYLTMAEALKLTAQTFDRDIAVLSCCAT